MSFIFDGIDCLPNPSKEGKQNAVMVAHQRRLFKFVHF
nr:MAG TPA: hypothetical protein [Caudoviricetes sp.]